MKTLNKKLIAGALTALCAVSATAIELNVQAPARATPKPDLVVVYVNPSYLSGGSIIRVTVRNNGNATSGSAVPGGHRQQGRSKLPPSKATNPRELQNLRY